MTEERVWPLLRQPIFSMLFWLATPLLFGWIARQLGFFETFGISLRSTNPMLWLFQITVALQGVYAFHLFVKDFSMPLGDTALFYLRCAIWAGVIFILAVSVLHPFIPAFMPRLDDQFWFRHIIELSTFCLLVGYFLINLWSYHRFLKLQAYGRPACTRLRNTIILIDLPLVVPFAAVGLIATFMDRHSAVPFISGASALLFFVSNTLSGVVGRLDASE